MENNDINYCYYSGLPSPMAYQVILEGKKELSVLEVDRVIEMAWEDRTPFEAIEYQFGLKEPDVKDLMKSNLAFKSYTLWRKRVESSNTKHVQKRNNRIKRFKCNLQRIITGNKISKR
jgi:uncharacterized protein (TIGR03643 family)